MNVNIKRNNIRKRKKLTRRAPRCLFLDVFKETDAKKNAVVKNLVT